MSYTGWYFDWIEEWSQFFQKCNWYTFRFAHIEVEHDKIMGGLEFTLVLLGLGFRVRWNHTETEQASEIIGMAEAVRSGELETKPWRE